MKVPASLPLAIVHGVSIRHGDPADVDLCVNSSWLEEPRVSGKNDVHEEARDALWGPLENIMITRPSPDVEKLFSSDGRTWSCAGDVSKNAAYIAAMSPDTTLALLAERAGFLARIAELEAGEESASRDYDEQPHLLPKASLREELG